MEVWPWRNQNGDPFHSEMYKKKRLPEISLKRIQIYE